MLVHQLDARNVLIWSDDRDDKGDRQVLVTPMAKRDGYARRWLTDLHPTLDCRAYGTEGTGSWEEVEDHSKAKLWLAHGKPYALDQDVGGQTYDGLGPLPAWLYAEEPPAPEPTLAEAQAAQLAQINRDFETAAQALTAGYPEAERLTWPIQQSEALAWATDNAAPTPYLDGLADARGITPAEMRALTLAQVQAFQQASQQLVGTRQRLRDEINAATTVADVRTVVWPSGGQA